jgi:TonB family protein
MRRERARLIALVGTIGAHAAVVAWLAAAPEQASRVLQVLDLQFVELPEPPTPAEPLPQPEPVAEPEPKPEPEPEPPRPRPVERRRAQRVDPEPQAAPEEQPRASEPGAEEPPAAGSADLPAGERVIDFGEQNFALPGAGTGFGMRQSNGGSRTGVYRPGSRGGGGGGSGGNGNGGGFAPVPSSMLSTRAELLGQLSEAYPEQARLLDIEGAVRLLVEIRSDGTVRRARALNDPGGGLAAAARSELSRARFRPARDRSGTAVATRIVYTVRYVLDA